MSGIKEMAADFYEFLKGIDPGWEAPPAYEYVLRREVSRPLPESPPPEKSREELPKPTEACRKHPRLIGGGHWKAFQEHEGSVTITSDQDYSPLLHPCLQPKPILKKKKDHPKPMVCNFCRNNRELRETYETHYLHDPVTKVLSCPVLRRHVCEVCGATGDNAHTLKYCRINRAKGGHHGNLPNMLQNMSTTNSAGKLLRNKPRQSSSMVDNLFYTFTSLL